jgi:hypothetical protein
MPRDVVVRATSFRASNINPMGQARPRLSQTRRQCLHTAGPRRVVACAPGTPVEQAPNAIVKLTDFRTFTILGFCLAGIVWALSLVHASTACAGGSSPFEGSSHSRALRLAELPGRVVSRPPACNSRPGNRPAPVLVDRDLTISEAANTDDLDGDDDDPIELPSRGLGPLLVLHVSELFGRAGNAAPIWTVHTPAFSQVVPPLRC